MNSKELSQSSLESSIISANEAYRAGRPLMTDEMYDSLIDLLKNSYPESNLLKTGILEEPVKGLRKQKLPTPMFSLNKCKSIEEVTAWLKKSGMKPEDTVIITPKFDGISIVVDEYSKKAWTRGDGVLGQESSKHYSLLTGSIPKQYDNLTFGEAIMPKKSFEKYKGEFANPRNMVAGLFNRDIPTNSLTDVHYVRYGLDTNILDKWHQLNFLNNLSLIKCPFLPIQVGLLTEDGFDNLYKHWGEEYQIDGLVIEINNSSKRAKLGREENMNPAYARAIKLPKWSGTVLAKVKDIKVQISKQGRLKPVVMIEPTEFGGVTISNVTGYNFSYVFDNNIAKDSIIEITRSGDVIPKHLSTFSFNKSEVQKLSDTYSVCPCCENQVKWDETLTELVCSNPDCEEAKIMKFVHFFSTMEFEEFGEPSVRRLWNAGYRKLKTILSLTRMELISIEGFGPSSAESFLNQVSKLFKVGVPFAKILDSFDLMDGKIGEKTIQLILDNSEEKDRISVESLIKIHGVARVTAETFINGWRQFWVGWHTDYLPEIKISYYETPAVEITGDKFKGQRICFTGCRPTKEQEVEIQQQGGTVVSGVNKNTTLLVVKNLDSKTMSSNKAVEATKLGIKIVEVSKL